MSKRQDRIVRKMQEIGAAYKSQSGKYIDPRNDWPGSSKPQYHVLPDVANPWDTSTRRFNSLKELESWLDARRDAQAADTEQQAEVIMYAWNVEHDYA